jgi:hypothetical protein
MMILSDCAYHLRSLIQAVQHCAPSPGAKFHKHLQSIFGYKCILLTGERPSFHPGSIEGFKEDQAFSPSSLLTREGGKVEDGETA